MIVVDCRARSFNHVFCYVLHFGLCCACLLRVMYIRVMHNKNTRTYLQEAAAEQEQQETPPHSRQVAARPSSPRTPAGGQKRRFASPTVRRQAELHDMKRLKA